MFIFQIRIFLLTIYIGCPSSFLYLMASHYFSKCSHVPKSLPSSYYLSTNLSSREKFLTTLSDKRILFHVFVFMLYSNFFHIHKFIIFINLLNISVILTTCVFYSSFLFFILTFLKMPSVSSAVLYVLTTSFTNLK